jgi:hypothetical protein
MRISRGQLPILLGALAMLAGATPALATEGESGPVDYDAALANARAAADRGEPREAARILVPIAEAYPQDYEVALQLGWYAFSAGDYDAAERAYREAIARAPAAADARLGLAWTLVRRGDCRAASDEIRALAVDPRAKDVAAACAPKELADAPPATVLSFAFTRWKFPGDSLKTGANGFLASASEQVSREWNLGLTYRYASVDTQQSQTSLVPPPGPPFPPRPPVAQTTTRVSSFAQHEAYAHATWSAGALGLGLHAAVLTEASGALGTSEHAGIVGRWSPFGDLLLDLSVSRYTDETIARVAPSWTIPIYGPLRVVTALAVQRVSGETLASASLSLLLDWRDVSFWAGGKYGQEERPAYLAQSVVYDLTDRVTWGAWGGMRVRLADGIGVSATYAYDRLRVSGSSSGQTSAIQTFTVGPIFSF